LAEAAACFGRALALDPDFADAHYNLGQARRALGDLAGAAESLRRAADLGPGDADAHAALGEVLLAAGDAGGAATAFRAARARRPRARGRPAGPGGCAAPTGRPPA